MSKENLDRQIEVLGALIGASIDAEKAPRYLDMPGWVQPRMCGAWDASHHSSTLKTLCNKGLAERYKKFSLSGIRNSFVYRPTEAGKIFYKTATRNPHARAR